MFSRRRRRRFFGVASAVGRFVVVVRFVLVASRLVGLRRSRRRRFVSFAFARFFVVVGRSGVLVLGRGGWSRRIS